MSEFGAFFSYARFDDEHDGEALSELRQRLGAEVRMQTGLEFLIFQDRDDILWGQRWRDRIERSLDSSTFLISVLSPSYFQSEPCLDEVRRFAEREKALGVNDLILPLYYVEAREIEGDSGDAIASDFRQRNYYDWRHMRFEALTSKDARRELAGLAKQIANRMQKPTVFANAVIDTMTDVDDAPGMLELMAESEDAMPMMAAALQGFSEEVELFGAITHEASDAITNAAAKPKPSQAKLAVTQKYALQVKEPAARMEALAVDYVDQVGRVDSAIEAMASHIQLTDDPETMEAARSLHKSLLVLVDEARVGVAAIDSMIESMSKTGSLSSTLRPIYNRITTSIRPVVESLKKFESWEARIGESLPES